MGNAIRRVLWYLVLWKLVCPLVPGHQHPTRRSGFQSLCYRLETLRKPKRCDVGHCPKHSCRKYAHRVARPAGNRCSDVSAYSTILSLRRTVYTSRFRVVVVEGAKQLSGAYQPNRWILPLVWKLIISCHKRSIPRRIRLSHSWTAKSETSYPRAWTYGLEGRRCMPPISAETAAYRVTHTLLTNPWPPFHAYRTCRDCVAST